MHKTKFLSAVFAVISSLVLLVSMVVPSFAATAVTAPVTVPSSWSGVSAGTAQTGYPYQYARVSVDSGSVVINKAVQTAGYLDLYWNNTGSGSNPSTIDLGLVDGGYTLKQGYHYILNLRILGFPMGNPTSTVVVTVSDGVLSRTQSVPAGVLTNFEWEYYPDKNIGISDLQLIIYNSTTAQEFYIYPLKILERSPDQNIIDNQNQNTQQIIDNQNQNTQQIIGNQNQNTQQIIGNQNQNTQDILNGGSLNGTSGVQDDGLSGAISEQEDAEDKINQALGNVDAGAQLDSAMNVQLDDNITGSFSLINTLFTRVVSTLDISVVLTFLLVFALAMYVVGRRTS